MLAVRDQENLVHANQTAAAGKSLNQGIRNLHPKTPGNLNTPFRAARNDENRPVTFQGQKAGGKDGTSKTDKNAFITPLGPRNRAPLGMKTTNAKAHTFKTPALLPPGQSHGTIRKSSTTRRSVKSKITIAQPEPAKADVLAELSEDEDEPDFGYAPPAPKELSDNPIDFDYDQKFPQFDGSNLIRGYGEIYFNSPKDENGLSIRRKKEEDYYQQYLKEQEGKASKNIEQPMLPKDEDLEEQVETMMSEGVKKYKSKEYKLETMKFKSAAHTLSDNGPRLPSTAMRQTQASALKQKSINLSSNAKQSTRTVRPVPSAVSKNTIGFPRAKQAPSILPRKEQLVRSRPESGIKALKIDQSKMHPKRFVELYGEPPVESDMWFRLREFELLEEKIDGLEGEEVGDPLFDTDVFPLGGNTHDEEDFQLPVPE